jgi:hypothetical protein
MDLERLPDTMSIATRTASVPRRSAAGLPLAALLCLLALLSACGGGGDNPFGNPATIDNPPGTGGRKLSFVYFQKCVNPIFLAQLQINQGGQISTNTCAGSGCHDNTSGTGGAFRVVPAATAVDLANPANTADVVRTSDMYKNFYSSQGEVIPGDPLGSRLVNKPLLRNVLHGGGLIFEGADDANLKRIETWINRPMPQGQDEFSSAANTMFEGGDPVGGACLIQ